ncbi:hypothetical protein [Embleya sp. NBC_00896]|uniref:hypothetical protein n=1 Tax=Embleya sp. NBC_00896 TaxID=2975961 RepID=UPI002F9125AC|nr:PQQ-like beta-propeller repeat protein [Embleya sp. NBC_00896]
MSEFALGYYGTTTSPYLAVRHSDELLFLRGAEAEDPRDTTRDVWVVAVDPPHGPGDAPEVRPLFPMEWDAERDAFVYGGPALRITDRAGSALVHAGEVSRLWGREIIETFVVRRSFPDGAAQWVFTAEDPVTALDVDTDEDTGTGTIYAAFKSGLIVALDAVDGRVRWQHRLRVGGFVVEPLSMVVPAPADS